MINEQYGRKRNVVGAHYGVWGFLIQRITAVILAVYSTCFLIALLVLPASYDSWVSIFRWSLFDIPLGKIFTMLAFLSMSWHAFIGARDIFMDYVKPAGLRLALHVFCILWLIFAIVYFANVLWSL
ncbi:succinate dehydrogenase, hydrophobic membrane anchor protein [Basilea psittacipulmonis]|uniref:Succinate dehydrogenase hydrophobic membrane anchor subunit n=1 Tax=Basilea psittacipulmonis DSM 24701 TaxID=1072685 RepID=A0A077DFS3_9BURK|nr:succinate dehydrogenase, hydrophobic membrane anchor protein [Basilea psittacipulmonis]AIL32207.1 succinate dehydrogenase [Basilea psittacipulmonis DSM 24701]